MRNTIKLQCTFPLLSAAVLNGLATSPKPSEMKRSLPFPGLKIILVRGSPRWYKIWIKIQYWTVNLFLCSGFCTANLTSNAFTKAFLQLSIPDWIEIPCNNRIRISHVNQGSFNVKPSSVNRHSWYEKGSVNHNKHAISRRKATLLWKLCKNPPFFFNLSSFCPKKVFMTSN